MAKWEETFNEFEYRNWLMAEIEQVTGTLSGRSEGLDSLYTASLEKLYSTVVGGNPAEDYKRYVGK